MTIAGFGTTPGRQDMIDSRGEMGELKKAISFDGRTNGLLRLNPTHKKLVRLYLSGKRICDIATLLNYDPTYVSILLKDPLIRQEIEEVKAEHEDQFDALYGMAIESLRDGMDSADLNHSLRAAAIYFKERSEKEARRAGGGKETAEDIIARMLQINIQVNGGNVQVERSKIEHSEE